MKRSGRPPRVRAEPVAAPEAIRRDLQQAIGDRLRAERDRRGLTTPQLAERAGVSARSLQGWLAGTVLPQLDQVACLAQALGVGRGWLAFGGREEDSR